tara:strand:- start:57 stop:227 length:171 start_codon:yes stop_codon:yes gene_type:complete
MSRNCEGFDLRGTYEHTLDADLCGHYVGLGAICIPRRDPGFQEEAGDANPYTTWSE